MQLVYVWGRGWGPSSAHTSLGELIAVFWALEAGVTVTTSGLPERLPPWMLNLWAESLRITYQVREGLVSLRLFPGSWASAPLQDRTRYPADPGWFTGSHWKSCPHDRQCTHMSHRHACMCTISICHRITDMLLCEPTYKNFKENKTKGKKIKTSEIGRSLSFPRNLLK